MTKKKRFYLILVVIIATLGLAVPVMAQSPAPISASVDRDTLTTDDLLILSVTMDGSTPAGQPQLPPLADFELISTGSSSQISIINGDIQMATVYQYTMRPLTTGELEIGPVTLTSGAQQFSTAPLTVTVLPGNGMATQSPNQPVFPGLPNFPGMPNFPNLPNFPASPPTTGSNAIQGGQLGLADIPPGLNGQEFFVHAQVDNPTPYQGEQVRYTFRFFQAAEIYDQPEYQAPDFSKFWQEEVEGQIEYSATAAGKNYRVTELTTILFPTVTGEIVIEPATLNIPNGIFSRGGQFQTDPVTLQVQRLPEPAPAGFNGAVGVYTLSAQVDPPATTVNETVTWQVILSGSGNIGNIADPEWPDMPEWRAFDSPAEVDAGYVDELWQGQRQYDRIMVPTQPGNLEIPALEYLYFNPDKGAYETARSAAQPVSVAPGMAGSTLPDPLSGNTVHTSNGVSGMNAAGTTGAAASGLRLQKDAAAQPVAARPLAGNPLFWVAWFVPLFIFAGHYGWQKWQRYRHDTAAGRYQVGAAGRALATIAQAKSNPAAAEKDDILLTYLSERLGEPMSGRTHQAIVDRLQIAGVSQELAGRVQNLLEQEEMRRYKPEGDAALTAYLNDMAEVIKSLERTQIQ